MQRDPNVSKFNWSSTIEYNFFCYSRFFDIQIIMVLFNQIITLTTKGKQLPNQIVENGKDYLICHLAGI